MAVGRFNGGMHNRGGYECTPSAEEGNFPALTQEGRPAYGGTARVSALLATCCNIATSFPYFKQNCARSLACDNSAQAWRGRGFRAKQSMALDLTDISNSSESSLSAEMGALGQRAKAASAALRLASPETRTAALTFIASELRSRAAVILEANARDVDAARRDGAAESFIDRLALTPERVEAMARGVDVIAALDDPLDSVISTWERPNGLRMYRVRTPLGVIGVIFESRPNVCADAASLCLRAGNPVILRGGSDSVRSCMAIGEALSSALQRAGLPVDAIQIVPTGDRAAVGMMLAGLGGTVDVIVPRGGKSLVERVTREARVPVFAHLEGICHTYLHSDADPQMAVDVVVNAKMRRVSVCGATETLLVDAAVAGALLPPVADALRKAGCALRGDEAARSIVAMDAATDEDFHTEYNAAIISIRVVSGIVEAMEHIAHYGSSHTEAIITENAEAAARFLAEVDSAIVLHNASTQFADGGEFGFGAEIGIATGRMHARGPVGAEQLTTFKYQVRGTGQIRP
jgi:glutamate-5-semialdehyde dehydrogenase